MDQLLSDFEQYVQVVEGGSQYNTWLRDNCGAKSGGTSKVPTAKSDAGRWFQFRDDTILGKRPAAPKMTTRPGQGYVQAGLIYLHATAPVGSTTTLPIYNVKNVPNYLSHTDPAASDLQAVWVYAHSPSTPYKSPDSLKTVNQRYMLLDPRSYDANGIQGRDEWWYVFRRYWPKATFNPQNHGKWGREGNLHNVAGDAGPNGGVGWGFGAGNSSLALDWLPGFLQPTLDMEPFQSGGMNVALPYKWDSWCTYTIQLIAGRNDGSTVRPGALSVFLDGSTTAYKSFTNCNTVQRAVAPDHVAYVQKWMQLWEGDYTSGLQQVTEFQLALAGVGNTRSEAAADRPVPAGSSSDTCYYSGSGQDFGPPSITQQGTYDFPIAA